jgi:hypothetical protein
MRRMRETFVARGGQLLACAATEMPCSSFGACWVSKLCPHVRPQAMLLMLARTVPVAVRVALTA